VTALVASFATSGASAKVGSVTQTSGATPNDFTNPVTYTVTAADGSAKSYIVTVYQGSTAGSSTPSYTGTITLTVSGIASDGTLLDEEVDLSGKLQSVDSGVTYTGAMSIVSGHIRNANASRPRTDTGNTPGQSVTIVKLVFDKVQGTMTFTFVPAIGQFTCSVIDQGASYSVVENVEPLLPFTTTCPISLATISGNIQQSYLGGGTSIIDASWSLVLKNS
jgi:hypothetical protein